MKKIAFILMLITVIGVRGAYAQDLLGKTKSQAKAVVTERIAPKSFTDGVGTSPTNGYDKYWYHQGKTSFLCYFNSKGVCFLECVMTNELDVIKSMIQFYGPNSVAGNHPKYHFYRCKTPGQANAHEFVNGKISVEVTTTYNQMMGEMGYFWFFKPEYKQDVLEFFNKYYN